jgi:hypothetical protein
MALNNSRQALSGSAPRQLTTFPKGYVYEYAFSRDGSKLYVAHGYQIRDAVIIKISNEVCLTFTTELGPISRLMALSYLPSTFPSTVRIPFVSI